jgi:hypothetical protein
MKRLYYGIGGIAVAALVVVYAARELPADDCTWPNPVDVIARVQSGTVVKPTWNQVICVLNRVASKVARTPAANVVCSSVSIGPGVRQSVTLALAFPLLGNEAITLAAQDQAMLGLLQADPTYKMATNSITGWVWNRDAVNIRTGNFCAVVTRPSG